MRLVRCGYDPLIHQLVDDKEYRGRKRVQLRIEYKNATDHNMPKVEKIVVDLYIPMAKVVRARGA